MGYLIDAIKGDYRSNSENRLSEIFAASFNHSHIFRKQFLRFVEDEKFKSAVKAKTQDNYSFSESRRQIDIKIVDKNDTPLIIIENKIESPLTNNQLKNYSRISDLRAAKKVALVKHCFETTKYPKDWDIRHWSDFYDCLSSYISRNKCVGDDRLIINNFMEYLEGLGMERVQYISVDELRSLASGIHTIRNAPSPFMTLGRNLIFETAGNYLKMLEEIVELIREETVITRKIGNSFRFAPMLGCWPETDEKQAIWIGITLELRRTYKGIKRIGTCIDFYNNDPRRYLIEVFASKKDWEYVGVPKYFKRDINFDSYAKSVISYWNRKLS